ncbi:hypothetical protein EUGRSUZ_F01138 [Eucalyptus grandis]|uniref:Uncharacterized protein n=2 Tax=Eucalyptus grandis TaxID=71139 RepID=A0ACC3KDA2_EUCGR|nr:hypothetical protein EUGRSUZ_F01138 [Eucalyptus grandis]
MEICSKEEIVDIVTDPTQNALALQRKNQHLEEITLKQTKEKEKREISISSWLTINLNCLWMQRPQKHKIKRITS